MYGRDFSVYWNFSRSTRVDKMGKHRLSVLAGEAMMTQPIFQENENEMAAQYIN